MKEKIASFIDAIKNKIDATKNKISSHYDIGMAVHEEDEHDDLTENRASAHKQNFKEKLAVAESTKERIIEKLRGNLIYIIIAVLIIVPGVFKLIGFFQEPTTASMQVAKGTPFGEAAQTAPVENKQIPEDTLETLLAQQGQLPSSSSDFSESASPEEAVNTTPAPEEAAPEEAVTTAPVPESASSEEPANTTPVPEFAPPVSKAKPDKETVDQENDDTRSMLANLFSFGDGSEEISDNIPEEKAVSARNAPSTTVASIPGVAATAKPQTAEQILQNYAAQESKIEDQLNKLLSRMDKLEENMATVSEIEERLAAIENNNQIVSGQQLQIVQTKLAELEQGIKQINQQAAKTITVPLANATSLPQNNMAAQPEMNAAPAITVEAVIPGRAWIRNQEGVLMVVQVGDDINGVGKVTRIDAREGTVATATQIFKQ